MKSHTLARFVAPPPPPAPKCQAPQCEMAPEVIVPLGESALELCWLCAHHHVDHGVPLSECATSERCEHTPDEIYPRGALTEMQGAFGTQAMQARPRADRGETPTLAQVDTVPIWHAPAKPAWCRGRGPDRVSRKRRNPSGT